MITVLQRRATEAEAEQVYLRIEGMGLTHHISRGEERSIIGAIGDGRILEDATRNTLDLSAVPTLKQLAHLPVLVAPSHGTGKWELVASMARAAAGAGAGGIMVEVHPQPEAALSEGPQALLPERFRQLMGDLARVAAAVGRTV